jgi:preprotein translocase subunit YajC
MESVLLQLAHSAVLLAAGEQVAGGAAAKSEQPGGMLNFVFLIGLLLVVFYFMMIRPQRRDQARRQEMLNGVKQNDHVVTIGGIYGVVTNVHRDADQVTIKVDESNNTKIRVTLGAIARILGDEPSNEAAKK